MAINRVGSKGITDGAVASADFKDGDITSAKLGDSQITNAKLSNTSFTLAGQSVSLGGSVSLNTTDWQSVITADGSTTTTAVAGQGYFIDTTSAAHTINLPASASIGDHIAIKDYAGTFATNNLTVGRNGHNIQGAANDSLISTNRASLVLVYVDSTKGWLYWEEHNVGDLQSVLYVTATGGTVTTSGDYKIHTFTGDGCFVVSCAGNASGSTQVDYLVVAGGGGGTLAGGGGGAGGYRESHSVPVSGCYTASPLATPTGITVSATTYPVTVGAGGAAPTSGSNSVFSTITSTGGGGANCGPIPAPYPNPFGPPNGDGIKAGQPGGSGGGSIKFYNILSTFPGGAGNTPPVSPPQGNPGGDASGPGGSAGAGGGGAGAAGSPGSTSNVAPGGAGGNGVTSSITGTPTARSGGGGGGGRSDGAPNPNQPGGSGGTGGGGPGGQSKNSTAGTAGTSNTGGGGGGGGVRDGDSSPGGAGGKGIVIIRYKYQN